MTYKEISIPDLELMVKECYQSDNRLIEENHCIAGSGLDACVAITVENLLSYQNYKLFRVSDNDLGYIGYFSIAKHDGENTLTSFALMKEARTEKIKKEFWEQMRCALNNESFFVILYSHNVPANGYVIDCGANVVCRSTCERTGKEYVLYNVK